MPEHHLQKPHASRLIADDDRLHGLRGSVVIGSELDGQTINIAEVKSFGNLLLVTSPLVSAAHDRSLRHGKPAYSRNSCRWFLSTEALNAKRQ